jgi:hypothetical protein
VNSNQDLLFYSSQFLAVRSHFSEWLLRTATNRLSYGLFSAQPKRDNQRLGCVPVGAFRPVLGRCLLLVFSVHSVHRNSLKLDQFVKRTKCK